MWYDHLQFDIASLELVAFQHPEWMFLILMIFAILQEDVATITIALLAAHGHIPVELGLFAAMAGIIVGDMGIFWGGWFARGHRYALHLLARHRIRRVKRLLKRNMLPTIMVVRCLPGMRLPTYFALGFFHASPVKFMGIAVGAVAIWSAFLFFLTFVIGDQLLRAIEGPWFWVAVSAFIGVIFFVPQIIVRRLNMLRDLDGEPQQP